MNILALETSSLRFSVAILKNTQVLAEFVSKKQTRGSEGLIPAVEKVLDKANSSFSKLNAFAISKGPGSFTGLRVGYAAIKGFALVYNLPVFDVSTHEVIAYALRKKIGKICVVQDAKKKRLYVSMFVVSQTGTIRKVMKEQILTFDQLQGLLQGKIFFLGDGIDIYKDHISSLKNVEPVFLPIKYWMAKARDVGFLAYEKSCKSKGKKAELIKPMYLYPKDCTITSSNK